MKRTKKRFETWEDLNPHLVDWRPVRTYVDPDPNPTFNRIKPIEGHYHGEKGFDPRCTHCQYLRANARER